jgi:hypothetical protein
MCSLSPRPSRCWNCSSPDHNQGDFEGSRTAVNADETQKTPIDLQRLAERVCSSHFEAIDGTILRGLCRREWVVMSGTGISTDPLSSRHAHGYQGLRGQGCGRSQGAVATTTNVTSRAAGQDLVFFSRSSGPPLTSTGSRKKNAAKQRTPAKDTQHVAQIVAQARRARVRTVSRFWGSHDTRLY